MQEESLHESVLMEEVLAALALKPTDIVVDATLGGAGHFGRLLGALSTDGILIGIDADPEAVERARAVVAADRRSDRPVVHLVNDNFRNLAHILERLGVAKVDKALFDLGWSGYQLASPRGFSFQKDEPLLMTYGEGGESAAEIVNSASEQELVDLLYSYGEERFARSIARAIVAKRAKARILTTQALVDAVLAGTPAWYQHRKIHAATKTFQALRIAANDEFTVLREGIAGALAYLAPLGRLVVISFHSVEDRIVKSAFRDAAYAGLGLASKKPVTASASELAKNRRARSAKLRVFEKNAARLTAPVSTFTYA
ncbi:MAG: 16S rRNA (cytosine(1402)-N(4))-methyltransferase RsmH [bacterium]|nr:16S rRNA (cytosine(1402)-N(4))-methyltransferase RsmH [bacterium]